MNHSKPYVAPPVDGLHWVESFDGDVWSRWTASSHEKYDGEFTVGPRTREALVGDVGFRVPEGGKHYGASASLAADRRRQGQAVRCNSLRSDTKRA